MEAAVVDQRKEQFPHAVALGTEPQFQLKVNPFGLRLLRDHFKGGELFDGVWCHQLAKLHKGQESLVRKGLLARADFFEHSTAKKFSRPLP